MTLGLAPQGMRLYSINVGKSWVSLHAYGYVLNDPINVTDPAGEYGLTGALGAAAFNLSLQFMANFALTGDLKRSIGCINIVDVAVSAALGAAGPTFLGNVLRGKLGPWAVSRIDNIMTYITVSLPVGWSVRHVLPDVAFGDECEGLGLAALLGEVAT